MSIAAKLLIGAKLLAKPWFNPLRPYDSILDEAIRRAEGRYVNLEDLHLGDVAIFLWLAEGTKDSKPDLRFRAQGQKAKLVEMCGHKAEEPVAKSKPVDYPFSREQESKGEKDRLEFYADWYGVERKYARPKITLPSVNVAAAKKFGIDRNTALLFPDTTVANRRWPIRYWNDLAEGLTAAGLRVLTLPVKDHQKYIGGIDVASFENVIACLSLAGLVVGVDSGPVNWASLFDVPTVAILGPTTANIYAHAKNIRSIAAPKELMTCVGCWFQPPYRPDFCNNGCLALANVLPSEVLRVSLEHYRGLE